MAKDPLESSQEFYALDVQASNARKELYKRHRIRWVLLCTFVLSLVLTILGVYYFLSPSAKKSTIWSTPFSVTGMATNIHEDRSSCRNRDLSSGKGSEEILEIHDFKNGITGIFFSGDPKCFIRNQMKGIPETSDIEMEEPEEEKMTSTYFKQSVVWVPGEKPVENKDFLKNSKILEFCENVTVYWMHPALVKETEVFDFENEGEVENGFPTDKQEPMEGHREEREGEKPGKRRQARQLTQEDFPVNDYTENGLEFHPLWDERGYCCAQCRRAHRYCQRVCEPLLGYYPYPYCYRGGVSSAGSLCRATGG